MKKLLTIATLVSTAVATSAVAGNDQFYAELNYAFPKGESSGYSVYPTVVAGRLGMNFTQNLAGEVFLGTGASSDALVTPRGSIDVKVKDVFGLYLKGSLPVARNFSVFGRVGYIRTKISASAGGFTGYSSDSRFSYGAGAQFNFTEKVYATLDYTQFYDKNDETFAGPTIGLGVKF